MAYGRNARLGGGVLPSPFEVLRGFFRMSSVVVLSFVWFDGFPAFDFSEVVS